MLDMLILRYLEEIQVWRSLDHPKSLGNPEVTLLVCL